MSVLLSQIGIGILVIGYCIAAGIDATRNKDNKKDERKITNYRDRG